MTGVLRLPLSSAFLLYQSIVLALGHVWSNKLRAVLTTLGIVIGVSSIATVIALIGGMKERVIAEFEAFGATKLFISPHWRQSDHGTVSFAKQVFSEDCFDEMLQRCPSVQSFARSAGFGALPVSYRGRGAEDRVNFVAVDSRWHHLERRRAAAGRPLPQMA